MYGGDTKDGLQRLAKRSPSWAVGDQQDVCLVGTDELVADKIHRAT